MSIASEKTRIESARNRIRNHLVSLGISSGTEKIDTLADQVESISMPVLTGNAEVGDVRAGKTFYNTNANAKQTGTLVVQDTPSNPYLLYLDDNNLPQTASITDISALCNWSAGTSYITVGGKSVQKNKVLAVFLDNYSGSNIAIGNYFCAEMSSLSTLTLPSGLTSIGNSFLYNCTSFSRKLTLPSGLTSIGNSFLRGCTSYNRLLALPSGLTSIGGYFLSNCTSMISEITAYCAASPTDTGSLSATDENAPMYKYGITVNGTYASTWKSRLPNRTSSPYRKLI